MPRKRHSRPSPIIDTTASSSSPIDSGDGDSDGGNGVRQILQPQRNAANARERARMRVLSRAFCRLKTTLPWVPPDTKLSKLDTLRFATGYIAHLRAVLTDQPFNGDAVMGQKHPISLTWPFSFQQTNSTIPSSTSCDGGGGGSESNCWNNNNNNINLQDSDDEEEEDDYHHPPPPLSSNTNSNEILHSNGTHHHHNREYPGYYQQYSDSLMHIG